MTYSRPTIDQTALSTNLVRANNNNATKSGPCTDSDNGGFTGQPSSTGAYEVDE